MGNGQIITAILGLIFVLGLALITIALLKWLQNKGADLCLCKKIKKTNHINIIEQRRLDPRNSVILLENDGNRYLLLVGADSSIIIDQTKVKGSAK